jgi:hypothetical protein
MNLARIKEIIMRKPHRRLNAEMVSEATRRLSERADQLSTIIKPYQESEDPLVMLLTDAIIQRKFREIKNGKP